MTEVEAQSKGSRPAGVANEGEASRKVREMFTQIAPRYDLLNHLLSLHLDRVWRARSARVLSPILDNPEALVLDLCCGTGDLALAFHHRARARVIGADFAHSMLVRAMEKSAASSAANGKRAIPFLEADALRLPFAGASLDLVAAAFGFRNLANYEIGLREILRVLKPGGTLAILEFTEPPTGVFGTLYRWYFRHVLPSIGAIISGNRSAYRYLPESVAHFFRPEELAALMQACGFEDAQYRVWTLGTLALHTARRKF